MIITVYLVLYTKLKITVFVKTREELESYYHLGVDYL